MPTPNKSKYTARSRPSLWDNSYVLASAISFDPQAELKEMRSPGVLPATSEASIERAASRCCNSGTIKPFQKVCQNAVGVDDMKKFRFGGFCARSALSLHHHSPLIQELLPLRVMVRLRRAEELFKSGGRSVTREALARCYLNKASSTLGRAAIERKADGAFLCLSGDQFELLLLSVRCRFQRPPSPAMLL